MNYIKTLALSVSALLSLTACSEECDRCDQLTTTSSEVLDPTMAKLEEHSDTWWKLIYYPDTKHTYGGYSIYLQFKDGYVTALSELNTTPQKSSYAVKQIDMPTLTFNTSNKILHHFSNPSESFRNGRGGDFELLVMGEQEGDILLQGRKYHERMSLVPMKGDPLKEIASIQQTTAKLQGKGLTSVTIGTAGTVDLRLHPTYRQIVFSIPAATDQPATTDKPTTSGKATNKVQVPFRYTPEGLLFYEPVTIGGVTISGFRLSTDGKHLTSIEGDITTDIVSLPIDLVGKKYSIYVEENYSSPSLISYFNKVNKALQAKPVDRGATINTYIQLGSNTQDQTNYHIVGNDTPTTTTFTLPINQKKDNKFAILSYEVDFVPVASDPTLLDIILRDPNEASGWYWYADTINYLLKYIASRAPYKISTYTDDNGATYYHYCSSTKDDKMWFYLYEVK